MVYLLFAALGTPNNAMPVERVECRVNLWCRLHHEYRDSSSSQVPMNGRLRMGCELIIALPSLYALLRYVDGRTFCSFELPAVC